MANTRPVDFSKRRGTAIHTETRSISRLGIESATQFGERIDIVVAQIVAKTSGLYPDTPIRESLQFAGGSDHVKIIVEAIDIRQSVKRAARGSFIGEIK